jgi:hypothetical protein
MNQIKRRRSNLGPDASPHAVIWRPIEYFSYDPDQDEDDLDSFNFISYAYINDVFDIRVYRQHPEMTASIYFLPSTAEMGQIREKIASVVDALAVPDAAVAWRRGDAFRYGSLERKKNDRLRESEARILVLKIAAVHENHTASTTTIKANVPQFYPLSDRDLARSITRPAERLWQQIVGNVKVHHAAQASIFSRGLAERTADGVRVTANGIAYLKSIGFMS